MCGIHLIIDPEEKLGSGPIQRMINATGYRGPDDEAFEIFQGQNCKYYLGSNRLKITDKSDKARQPLTSANKKSSLVFNGEIYNFRALRKQLENSGENFVSRSDTEVLHKLLSKDSHKSLARIHGMFAFIYLNIPGDEIIIARDRWGMKPLYYYQDESLFIASSEIKSILASGLVKKELNEPGIFEYLQYRHTLRPNTLLKNIYEFEIDAYLKIVDGKLSPLNLRKINPEKHNSTHLNDTEIISKTEELLFGALEQHIPDYSSSALFLSGGVDSTLILALLAEMGYQKFPTYTIINTEKDRKYGTADYNFARNAAKVYGSKHHEVTVDVSLMNDIDEFVEKIDHPVGDSGALLTYLLSTEVSKDHRIILSGSGADELFAGYNRHAAFNQYLKNHGLLSFVKGPGLAGARMLSKSDNETTRLFLRFFEALHKDPAVTFNRFISFNDLTEVNEIPLWTGVEGGEEHLAQALMFDRNNYLVSDVLTVGDRMSMMASTEMRIPYLDDDVCNFALSIPPSILLKNGKKWILKELLKKRKGEAFARRPKEGFGLPFAGWININNTNLWSFLHDKDALLFNFIQKNRILEMKKDHQEGRRNYSLELWSVMILAKWLDTHFS